MSPLKIVAIVLFVISVVLAVMGHSFLDPLYLMVSAFAVLAVFGGVIP